jgi:AcrR family transcriptional regulator
MEKRNHALGPEDWLAQALKTLEEEGVSNLRVERLARSLGVTKGSFYWHFKDRQDLLDRLLDYWAVELTTKVIDENRASGGNARRRLRDLMVSVTQRELGRYDLAVRAWAVFDKRAAKTVGEIDKSRLAYVKELFSELGFRGRSLEMRARAFVYYQVAEPMMLLPADRTERIRLLELRHDLLTRH